MLYKFINNNSIERQPKTLKIGETYITNPSDDLLIQNGYKELIASEAPSEYCDVSYVEDGDKIRQVWTEWDDDRKVEAYPDVVSRLVAEHYSITDELALLRQRDTKPNKFAQYNDFVERCKLSARLLLGLDRTSEDIDYYSDSEALNDIKEAVDNG